MQTRKIKLSLQLAGLVMGLASVTIFLWCVFWPCDVQLKSSETGRPVQTKNTNQPQDTKLSLKQFEPFWQKPIRRPLFDPPPKTVIALPAVVEKRPPPNLKLIGVAIESDHSLAMFLTAKGTVEVKGVGDTIGDNANDPQVVAINDQRVTLRYQGEKITLALEEDKTR